MNFNLIPDLFNHINSEVIGNIVLFISYGILYPSHKKETTVSKTLSNGLKLTLIIELIQPIFGRSFDVNDIIMNFSGVLMSSIVYFLIVKRINEQLHFS